MLDDYKHLCEVAADIVPNWRELDKNDLCRLCVANENTPYLYNAYMSAILYKYWNLIPKFHASCNGIVSPETVYDWLIDSINYALKHRRWESPDSSIYNDPNGPDKVINRKMKCTRINLYQFTNRKKRKDEFGIMSLDELTEKVNDTNFALVDKENTLESVTMDIRTYISKIFGQEEYFLAYLLDAIVNGDVFEPDENGVVDFSMRKILRFMRTIDDAYIKYFIEEYSANPKRAKDSIRYIKSIDSKVMVCKVESSLYRLRHDKSLLKMIRG